MRFLIQVDKADMISGYVVPDNPSAIGRVAVVVDGRRVLEVPASRIDISLRDRGWHNTGQCKFLITQKDIPNLSAIEWLDLYDVDTNTLIYRRVPPNDTLVKGKVVLVNTSIHPETVIQSNLFPHFKQAYFNIGKMSEEVLLILFNLAKIKSCLLSGAFAFPRYEANFVGADTLTMMLLHDPYVELANRLIWLRERAEIAEDPDRRWQLGPLAEAATFTVEFDYTEARSLKRLFRLLPEPAYHLLYNPLTRQLGTKLPGDRIVPAISIIAVEVLARVGIVGHRDYFAAFVESVHDGLGIRAEVPEPTPIAPEALALAELLRSIAVARDMVNFDEVICDGVLRSLAKEWGEARE